MMKGGETVHMNQKLNLAIALALGLFGGVILSHFPMPVFAQSQPPVLMPASAQRVTLTTGLGIKLGDLDLTQGTIKLSPVVKLHLEKTDRTVSLELTAGEGPK
jgi:hypothetical protein